MCPDKRDRPNQRDQRDRRQVAFEPTSPKLKVEPDPIALLGAGFEITVLKIFGHFIKNVLLFLQGERKWKYLKRFY
jgi:hypothetical protein